jgi:cell division septation protein DedD
MNRNLARGLGIGIPLLILAVGLYFLYFQSPSWVGPPPVTTPSPGPAPGSTATAPPATAPTPAAPSAFPVPSPAGPSAGATVPTPQSEEAKITHFPPEKPSEHFAIPLARFHKYRSAEKILGKMKKRGIPGFIRRDPSHRRPYQLWAGPFTDPKEAEAARKKLRALFRKVPEIEKLELPVPK